MNTMLSAQELSISSELSEVQDTRTTDITNDLKERIKHTLWVQEGFIIPGIKRSAIPGTKYPTYRWDKYCSMA